MKTKIMIVTIALFVATTVSLSFAETYKKERGITYIVISGQIESVDVSKNFIIVRDESTGLKKTVYINPAVVASLQSGEKVQVTLEQGSNLAQKITK